MSPQELLRKMPPYDFEDLMLITEAFYKYCNDLHDMGKHELFTG